jgi:hypothetical protein
MYNHVASVVHADRLLHSNFHARLFWRKYVTTNEAVSSVTLLHSLHDFLVNYLAVEASEVDTLLSPGNRDLLVATVDSSGEGIVSLLPYPWCLRLHYHRLPDICVIDGLGAPHAMCSLAILLIIAGVCDRVCDAL